MSVDMHEYKFIMQLEKLPRFEPGGEIDPDVRAVDFPAWRAPFSSLALLGHATGYRLFSFDAFFRYCERVYTHDEHANRFSRWFAAETVERTKQRIKFWYESGMAEMYLYVCLVDALEDILKEGIVFYDARVDWKQKWDAALTVGSHRFAISALWGSKEDRPAVEEHRDSVERMRKERTLESSHWANRERRRWTELVISRSEADCQTVNGVRLFSIPSIDALLSEIYQQAGIEDGFLFPSDLNERKKVYYGLIGG